MTDLWQRNTRGSVLVIFASLLFAFFLFPQQSSAATITVCVNGCTHTTIQAAVDAIPQTLGESYTIEIRDSRTYEESVRISGKKTTAARQIFLRAKSGETPTMRASSGAALTLYSQQYVIIDGIHFSGGFRNRIRGVDFEGSGRNTLRNSRFSEFNAGSLVTIHEGENNRIEDNLFEKSRNATGVFIYYYNGGNLIQRNTFINLVNGIVLGDRVRGNTIRENTFFLDGSIDRAIVSRVDLARTRFSSINANRYYLNRGAVLGVIGETPYATLGAWQNATGFDTSAEEIFVPQDPRFSPWAEMTKTVCASQCDFATIQAALAAMPNLIAGNKAYRVEVRDEGPYDGEILVTGLTDADRTITITAGPNVRPVIRQGSYTKGFSLRSVNYVTIRGFRFPGGQKTHFFGGPIFVEGSNNTIEDNIIGGDRRTDAPAIVLHRGTKNRVVNNRIQNISRGVFLYSYSSDHLIRGNTIADTFSAVGMNEQTSGIQIEHNTFFQNTHGIDIGSDGSQCFDKNNRSISCNYTIRNNVIVSDGIDAAAFVTAKAASRSSITSDYQNFFSTGGAQIARIENSAYPTLADWQTQGHDAHSMDVDPLFADAEGPNYDFHLKSRGGRFTAQGFVTDTAHSPAIDAGDPALSVGEELAAHGGRVNIGAYGGTREASKSFTSPLGAPEPVAPVNDVFVNGGVMTWKDVQQATRYDVEIGTTQATVATFPDVTGLSQEIPSTLPDGEYVWRVRADDGTRTSAWSALSSFTLDRTPPTEVVLDQPSDTATVLTSPTFSWTPVVGAFRYEFHLAYNAQFTTPLIVRSDLTESQFTPPFSLQEDAYFWRVRARDRAGNVSVAWAERSFTLAPPIQPPTLAPGLSFPGDGLFLSLNIPSPSSFPFIWSRVPGATAYTLQFSTQQDFSGILLERNGGDESGNARAGDVRHFVDLATFPEGQIFWRVRGNNLGGVGPWSEPRVFTFDTTAPQTPVLHSHEPSIFFAPAYPEFNWDVPQDENGVAGQTLQVATDVLFSHGSIVRSTSLHISIRKKSGPPVVFSLAPPLGEGTYFWRVRVGDSAGNASAWSAPATFTVLPPSTLDAPTLLAPQDGIFVPTPPTLSWSTVSRALRYDIEAATSSDFDATDLLVAETVHAPRRELFLSRTAFSGQAFDRVFWRVRAANNDRVSDFSEPFTFIMGPADCTVQETPRITSGLPRQVVTEDDPYDGVDIDSSVEGRAGTRYELLQSPPTTSNDPKARMQMDAATGVITWRPVNDQVGVHTISYRVTERCGGSSTQQFTVVVTNDDPIITSTPVINAEEGKLYTYDVENDNDEGVGAFYTLTLAPEGMTIHQTTGVISWSNPFPSAETRLPIAGRQFVTVEVDDTNGGIDTQSYLITVAPARVVPDLPRDAPTLLAPEHDAFFETSELSFQWTETGESEYRLEIANTAVFDTGIQTFAVAGTEKEVSSLDDGIYFWRVRGVTTGVSGRFSVVRSFTLDRTVRRDIDLRRVIVTHYPERASETPRAPECRAGQEYTCSDDDIFRIRKGRGSGAPIVHVPRQDALAHELRTRGLQYTTTKQEVTTTRLVLGRVGRVYDVSSVGAGGQIVVAHDTRTTDRVLKTGHELGLAHRDPASGVWDIVESAVYNRKTASFTAPAEEGSYTVVIFVEKRGSLRIPVPLRVLGGGKDKG